MPRARAHPLRYSELRRRLEAFGATELLHRGKGSERIFIRRDPLRGQERTYPIKCHGQHTELGIGTIAACLRRLGFNKDEVDQFWSE